MWGCWSLTELPFGGGSEMPEMPESSCPLAFPVVVVPDTELVTRMETDEAALDWAPEFRDDSAADSNVWAWQQEYFN